MRVIYGTTNAAKINSMKKWLKPLDIEIIGINEIGCPNINIDELGSSPIENAVIKAEMYFKWCSSPVFSCDSGLFIDGLPPNMQPDVYVRRVCGRELSDEEMIQHYSELSRKLGGSAVACYRNAVCYISDDGIRHTYDGEDIGYEKFILADKAHEKRIPGFPLDSLSVDIKSGKYYFDTDEKNSMDNVIENGFVDFFVRCGIKYRDKNKELCNGK